MISTYFNTLLLTIVTEIPLTAWGNELKITRSPNSENPIQVGSS